MQDPKPQTPNPKLSHIGIAVSDLDAAAGLYRLLGIEALHREIIPDQGVELMVLPVGGTRIELLRPLSSDTPVARFIAKRGEGLHHIALEVDDIRAALDQCREAGMELLDAEPRIGAEGALIAFLNPKSTNGVLMELVQKAASPPIK